MPATTDAAATTTSPSRTTRTRRAHQGTGGASVTNVSSETSSPSGTGIGTPPRPKPAARGPRWRRPRVPVRPAACTASRWTSSREVSPATVTGTRMNSRTLTSSLYVGNPAFPLDSVCERIRAPVPAIPGGCPYHAIHVRPVPRRSPRPRVPGGGGVRAAAVLRGGSRPGPGRRAPHPRLGAPDLPLPGPLRPDLGVVRQWHPPPAHPGVDRPGGVGGPGVEPALSGRDAGAR